MTKTCTKCHIEKELTEFYRRTGSSDGRTSLCKSCEYLKMKAYRKTPAGKESQSKYWKSEKGKKSLSRYNTSDKGRATKKKYAHSERGILMSKLYFESEHGRQVISAYQASDRRKAVVKKYYASERGKETRNKYREKHRKRILAYSRAYNTSPSGKAAFEKYYNSDKGRSTRRSYPIRSDVRARYVRSPEGKAAFRRFRMSEKGKINSRLSTAKRRSRMYGSQTGPINVPRVYALCNNQCIYCGSIERLTLDHVVALASGGSHTEDNLVVACKSCNSSKGKKPLEEWIGTRVRRLADGAVMRMEEAV